MRQAGVRAGLCRPRAGRQRPRAAGGPRPSAPPRRAAPAAPPRAQLLVETDAPYLTPMPHRGKPNGPYLIPLTVRSLAVTTGAELAELRQSISANGERIFGPW